MLTLLHLWGCIIIFHGEVLILLIYKYCIIIWLLHSALMNIHSDYSSLEIFFLNVIYSRAFSPMQALFLFPWGCCGCRSIGWKIYSYQL